MYDQDGSSETKDLHAVECDGDRAAGQYADATVGDGGRALPRNIRLLQRSLLLLLLALTVRGETPRLVHREYCRHKQHQQAGSGVESELHSHYVEFRTGQNRFVAKWAA